MKKNILLFTVFYISFSLFNIEYAQLNISFKSNLKFPGKQLSNIWGYAANGKEYALVGHSTGMSVVNVTDPENPVELFLAQGPNSIWREVRTKGNYAFVTTEGGGGLQIVNLQYLPDSIQKKNWTGDSIIAGQLNTIHALHVDGDFLYLYGSNISNPQYHGHPIIVDVSDPWNPHFAGQVFHSSFTGNASYVHDGIVRNDTGYFGHIYAGFFSVWNISDKANPVLLATQNTPNNFTHNTWLSDNGKILFTTDEVDNSFLASYDVSDVSDIKFLDKVQQNPGSNSVVHNTYVLNDYAVTSWYKEGVVIVDGSRPENLVITGFYDTSPLSGSGMEGDWGVYPYLPSGNLLISDMQEGLFVLAPNYVRGCYLEGTITESGTGNPIFGATITILNTTETTNSKPNGNYACGLGIAGTYNVKVEKTGYQTKIINGVALSNSNVTTLNVQLDISTPFSLMGLVRDSVSSNSVPFAEIIFSTALTQYSVTADSNGVFSLDSIFEDNYDITVGKWGYRTICFNQNISSSTGNMLIELSKGIYDDFSFDFGWTITSTATAGIWEIGEPVGTTLQTSFANPDFDVDSDCGNQAFVTGNGGGSVGDDDVDNGKTTITSPVFDCSNYSNAYLSYYRWFFNGGGFGGNPNDTLKIKLNNGTSTVVLEIVTYQTPGMSSWVFKNYKISDYITITPSMKIIVETADIDPGHIVEAGFDVFQVYDSVPSNLENLKTEKENWIIFPNPNGGNFELRNENFELRNETTFKIYNILGEETYSAPIRNHKSQIRNIFPGIYFARIETADGKFETIKFVVE